MVQVQVRDGTAEAEPSGLQFLVGDGEGKAGVLGGPGGSFEGEG